MGLFDIFSTKKINIYRILGKERLMYPGWDVMLVIEKDNKYALMVCSYICHIIHSEMVRTNELKKEISDMLSYKKLFFSIEDRIKDEFIRYNRAILKKIEREFPNAFKYDEIKEFSDNKIIYAKLNNKWGIIRVVYDKNIKGFAQCDWMIPPTLDDIKEFNEIVIRHTLTPNKEQYKTFAPAKKGNKWGYVNMKGDWAIKPRFDNAYEFNIFKLPSWIVRFAKVYYDGKCGLIQDKEETDEGFSWVVEPKFHDLGFNYYGKNLESALCKAFDGRKWGFIDLKGNWVVEPQFDDVEDFDSNGIARVAIDTCWGTINSDKWFGRSE